MKKEAKTLARHLCTYITDLSAVAIHVNRQYQTRFTADDIKHMFDRRAIDSVPRKTILNSQPISSKDLPISTTTGKGYDPLAKALFAYHAARTTGETRSHWRRLAA